MVSQNGIKLAAYLVSSYFGLHNAKVIECLLQRGTLTLSQITQFTELTRADVSRRCLVALIHHNCVQAFSVQQDGGFGLPPKVLTQYMALFDNIIHRMCYPKFIAIVSEELGAECEKIFEALLQHGRLSLSQIVDRHKQTVDKEENFNLENLQESFSKLVHGRLVERCPSPEPFLAPPSEEEEAAAKKRSSRSKVVIIEETIEQRALAAAAPLDSRRFLVELDDWTDASARNSEESSSGVKVGEKRKKDVLEPDSGSLDTQEKKEVLWRVNIQEFIRRLRNKACVANVNARLNADCGIVLSAMLELTRSTDVKPGSTAPLAINDIYDEVIKHEGGVAFNMERVEACLVQLGCEQSSIGLDEPYSVDLKSIVETAQNEEVESIVLKRYGREAYRMFRLLAKAGHLLETEKIADATFIEKKDCLRILYQLWKDDYLHMEKISVSAARQSQFLLWKVNKKQLWEHVLDEMYHAALNLRLRIAHDQEQDKEILQMSEEKIKAMRNLRVIYESSFSNLADAVMLFQDF